MLRTTSAGFIVGWLHRRSVSLPADPAERGHDGGLHHRGTLSAAGWRRRRRARGGAGGSAVVPWRASGATDVRLTLTTSPSVFCSHDGQVCSHFLQFADCAALRACCAFRAWCGVEVEEDRRLRRSSTKLYTLPSTDYVDFDSHISHIHTHTQHTQRLASETSTWATMDQSLAGHGPSASS